MNENNIKRYTKDELRELSKHGASRTDIARCEATSDDDVERAIANDRDWEGVPADWYLDAEAAMPRPKVPVNIRLDADLVDYLRSTGRGWQTRVNAILRAYKEARQR